jgi:tRNA uridine 5-carboxymethylaminomethyl modification enzyme
LDQILSVWPDLAEHGGRVLNAAAVDAVYAVYLDRQQQDIAQRQKEEGRVIPADFDYGMLGGLSNELKQKLERVRPPSVGHAERIEGMTPAAVALLLSHLRRKKLVRMRRTGPPDNGPQLTFQGGFPDSAFVSRET